MSHTFGHLKTALFTSIALSIAAVAAAGAPSVEQALKLAPMQKDVEYDIPTAAEVAKCTIKAEKIDGQTGWVVRNASGQILRQFVDTNGDNIVDRWSYYKDGIEVYRDIDSNYNGKADQSRWLNTAGTRWGIEKEEDGKIDYWKQISPEEVTAEIVMAVRDKDPARFNRVLLSASEAKAISLPAAKSKQLNDKITAAPAAFDAFVRKQRVVTPKTIWVHFGGTRPGLVPAADGNGPDLTVYENVLAMMETDGKDSQLQIGTLIKVGDVWRVIDAPSLVDPNDKTADDGFFFSTQNRLELANANSGEGAPNEQVQKMMDELSKLDEAVGRATTDSEQTRLNDRRAELMTQIAEGIGDKDRPQWIRQFADAISAAAQTGAYPTGVEKLKALVEKLSANTDDALLVPYVKYRYLQADYGSKLQRHEVDFVKVQSEWLENLEQFVKDYPKATDTAEALLQLGLAQEFAGQEDKAKKWYGQLVSDFGGSAAAVKARGAVARLDSVGQPMQLRGKATNGQPDDIAKYKGKYVLVHYWATWSDPCKTDLAQLKELYAKFGKSGFALIGVSLDNNASDLNDYLTKNRLPWTQLYEPGGLESRFANEMGILTLPTMILVDDKGKVVNRNIHITELENDLKSRLKQASTARSDSDKAER
jgi:thiol-disulfide isomerase/thioredoxin